MCVCENYFSGFILKMVTTMAGHPLHIMQKSACKNVQKYCDIDSIDGKELMSNLQIKI